jgi:hypothetical protein
MVAQNRELSEAMSIDLQKKLQQVINTNKDKKHYFIVVTLGMEENCLRTNILLISPIQASMLATSPLVGTMMFEVDNRSGFVGKNWVLPKDFPMQGRYDGGNEFVHNSSKLAPIRHGKTS